MFETLDSERFSNYLPLRNPFTALNRCGPFRFVNNFSIIEKLNLVACQREHLTAPARSKFQIQPAANCRH